MHILCSVTQSHLTLCNIMDCSSPGFSVHGIPRQEYWSLWSFPLSGDLPDLGIKPTFPVSPALAGEFSTTEPLGKPTCTYTYLQRTSISSRNCYPTLLWEVYIFWILRKISPKNGKMEKSMIVFMWESIKRCYWLEGIHRCQAESRSGRCQRCGLSLGFLFCSIDLYFCLCGKPNTNKLFTYFIQTLLVLSQEVTSFGSQMHPSTEILAQALNKRSESYIIQILPNNAY